MDTLMTIIKERRSVRNFTDQPVPAEYLQTIMEAVRWTPSWANTQCWEIVVVKDLNVKDKIHEAVPGSNPGAKAILKAPVLLALCAKRGASGYYKDLVTTKFGDWFMFDLGLAAQSICLTAHALGLGTVILGLYEHDKVNAVLHLPENMDNVCLIPLGFPERVPGAPKRKTPEEFVHDDRF